MSRSSRDLRSLFIVAALTFLSCVPTFGQTGGTIIDLADGTSVKVTTKFNKGIAFGPKQAAPNPSGTTDGLAFYTANYTSLGVKALPFNIVGTDPSLGANTTTIPTILVPLKFVFPVAPGLPLDGTHTVAVTENSPIFLTADYTFNGLDLGVTQYGDAVQRGEFWNLAGFSENYHVLLGSPTVAPTVTVNVPVGKGNLFRLRSGQLLGVVDNTFFDSVLAGQISGFTANQLPIFLTDEVYLAPNGNIGQCCVLGFHNSQGPPITTAQTFIYAAFTHPGTFRGDVILDIQPLSHEVAEWLNDPFVGTPLRGGINLVAPYILPNTGGACQINFETGDVLENPPSVFTQTTNGTLYHLQDEAFITYFLQTNPSFSENGFYSLTGTFTGFSTLCGPG
jgi:hypothetical protein